MGVSSLNTRGKRVIAKLVCMMLLMCLSCMTHAQSAFDGYTHRIRTASSIEKLGPNLFGDSTNMLDGSTTFNITDVVVPTNGMVPLSIGRTYRVDGQVVDQDGRTFSPGLFGMYWELDVPYMVGTFDASRGWVGQNSQVGVNTQTQWWSRCTQGGPGPSPLLGIGNFSNVLYQPQAFFSGIYINIPGSGMQQMLMPNSGLGPVQTAGGYTYYYNTKGNWLVGCVGSIQNSNPGSSTSGEGYTVRLPDGRTYTFAFLETFGAPYILDDSCGTSDDILPSDGAFNDINPDGGGCTSGLAVPRSRIYLYATQATDRFGNTVTYNYDPGSGHLLSVSSSDGALISLSYNSNGYISGITAGTRQWTYAYDSNNALQTVTLPDGSSWSINLGQNTAEINQYNSKVVWAGCKINIGTETTGTSPGPSDTNVVTMTHPSGATGVFTFRRILHGTRQAESSCTEEPISAGSPGNLVQHLELPSDYQTSSLVSKALTIPGASNLQWTYTYQPGWTSPYQAVTTVTDSAGTVTAYTFGTFMAQSASDPPSNYGQLQQETITNASGTVLRTVGYQYVNSSAGQNYPDAAGRELSINLGWELGFDSYNRPLYSTTISQQGRNFSYTVNTGCPSSGVYCFDNFVRPTQITRSSQ